ncbi:MarR family transcriptional regulator [Clavibacter michiganensis]|uniref:MarR family transcriptional regulator n=1 Tax=Clavibacter michiganensis TaxID=28447 RepID=UPI0009A74FD1|nr:MarR family transcriptional regulator [Clavibacter michiganensis]MBF4638716.1 MarR family transcriptional regulator [Clavibacter michiganensis subsp. michiganensis]MBW8027879.1 MarR family transcriptional regulator [Clavibacter michiganensis subsp. michiganensis]MDO4044930.1 MarR family transcriptional regulator [Clavibacter michiganensis]MDO4053872.1 MarR family transcriptional regulator [Clavibacter michiganensis]MDO4056603.1 MarR family transcriptional regulator [Clavibacter michiganensi
MVDRSTHEQIITAMTQVFDLMDGATLEVWDGLTGLQIQLLRVVATDMRVDRQSLSTWTRTSRAALVPSLGALLQRGILAEEPDDEGVRLVVGTAGRELLERVLRARAEWIREACTAAAPAVDDAELQRIVGILRRIADGT